jgi:hypothetical protein
MAFLVLAVQLAVGGLLWSVVWRDTSRAGYSGALRRGALIAAAVAAAVALLGWLTDGRSPAGAILTGAAREARWPYLVGGLLSAPGAFLVLAAGRAEHSGDLATARREVRRGGFLMAGGAVVEIGAILSTLWLSGFTRDGALLLWASLSTAGAAGFAGLLAGLAGKPRPTGYLAAALLMISVVTWLAACEFAVDPR